MSEKERDIFVLISRYRSQLMGFAALWIWIFHVWMRIFKEPVIPYVTAIEEFFVKTGFCGVDIFFFLSGAGLVHAIKRPDFYRRRFSRLLPPHFIMAIVFFFSYGWSVGQLVKNLTGFNFLFHDVNDFLWFNFAIAIFYLLFPLYDKLMGRGEGSLERKLYITGILLVLWLFLSIFLRDILREDLYGFTNRIPVFLLGGLFGYGGLVKKQDTGRLFYVLGLLLLGCGIYLSFLTNFRDYYLLVELSNCCIPNLFMSLGIIMLLPGLLQKLSLKWLDGGLAFLGSISLELYCVYHPVERYIKGFLKPYLPRLVTNLIVLAAGIFIAYLLRRLCSLVTGLFKRDQL